MSTHTVVSSGGRYLFVYGSFFHLFSLVLIFIAQVRVRGGKGAREREGEEKGQGKGKGRGVDHEELLKFRKYSKRDSESTMYKAYTTDVISLN